MSAIILDQGTDPIPTTRAAGPAIPPHISRRPYAFAALTRRAARRATWIRVERAGVLPPRRDGGHGRGCGDAHVHARRLGRGPVSHDTAGAIALIAFCVCLLCAAITASNAIRSGARWMWPLVGLCIVMAALNIPGVIEAIS